MTLIFYHRVAGLSINSRPRESPYLVENKEFVGRLLSQGPDQGEPQFTRQRHRLSVEQQFDPVGSDCVFSEVIQFVKFLDLPQRESRAMQRRLIVRVRLRNFMGVGGGFELSSRLSRLAAELRIRRRDVERRGRLVRVKGLSQVRGQGVEEGGVFFG